jgi:hypothetical protein
VIEETLGKTGSRFSKDCAAADCSVNKQKCFSCVVLFCFVQQVEEKEGQSIMLDRRYCAPSSNRLLMFLQSPRGQMRGALDPSPDVGLSNLSPLVVGGGGSSQEFVDGAKGSLCQNLSLGGGGGWENNHHNYHHNQGCESQSSGCALSLLSWGTTPCPPALDLCVDNTSLDHHHHQLVADNNMGSNTVASFATHQLPRQQTQEHYLAFEKLFSAQSGGLGGMGIGDIRITDIQQQQQPLEQSQLHGVGGGGGDDGASGNFLSYLGGLGLDAGNSMLALFQSSHDLQGMRSGVSSAHQSLKVTSDLVCTPSLQVHQQHHLHQVHTTTTSVHSQMQTSFNGGGGEYGEFGPSLHACESSLFSTQHMR